MNEYMITVRFPEHLTEEFISRIPRQRALVHALMEKGVMTSYSLSSDREQLWMTVLAKNEDDVRMLLRRMPLYDYMDLEIRPLMFHNAPIVLSPKFSAN